ncbi:major facilitator superfamily domain-containing protein, partial [Fusarium venenatum]|uniref:major facilitator superfamily domain-containing protein n=1 Tax=Fusarium venenatum TaxID=56646 RepID=UPI001D277754
LIQTFGHSDRWRWAFWVPAILAAFCFTLLLFFLPLNPVSGGFGEKIRKIDWLGVITSVPVIVLVVMSINSGGSIWPWDNVKAILILSIGIVCLLLFIAIEAFVAKIPIIPLRLLKTKSALVLILSGFLHDFVWQTMQYLIPLFFQTVCGYTPLESATLIVFFLIAQGLAGAASGPVMARYARYMPALRCGLAVWTLGAGLKLLFGQKTHVSIYVAVLAIEGAGVGWVHQPGLVALQANPTDEDRAVATGTRNVFRSLGGVVGIAVSTATYYAVLSKSLGEAVPNWVRDSVLDGTWRAGDSGTSEYESNILGARMEGFRAVFTISVPLIALCLIASLLVADIILKGDNDNVSEETKSRDSE